MIDRTIVGWRAWYTDGREFDSQSTSWADLPEDGVLGIVLYQRTRPYRRHCTGRSLYWKEETERGIVYCYDDANDAIISDEAMANGWVKRGLWVTDVEMGEVTEKMQAAKLAPNEQERIDREP